MPHVIVNTGTTRRVVVDRARTAAIASGAGRGTRVKDRAAVANLDGTKEVVRVASVGIQGPPGADGVDADNVVIRTSGQAISGGRVVKLGPDGKVYLASAGVVGDATLIVGVAVTATSGPDESLTVRLEGRMTDPVWSWTPGMPLYCGANGVLSHTPPAPPMAFVCEVARALTATEILVDTQTPIVRG